MTDRDAKREERRKQILLGLILLFGLALAGTAHSVLGRAGKPTALSNAVGKLPPPTRGSQEGLQDRLETIARSFAGTHGIMVRSLDSNLSVGFKGASEFPQGSLRRIWLAAALLEAVDQGELKLTQTVPLERGGGTEVLGNLLRKATAANDLAAQDEILAGLSGPPGMASWLVDRGFAEVSFGGYNQQIIKNSGNLQRNVGEGLATPYGLAFAMSDLWSGRGLSESSSKMLLGFLAAVSPRSYGLEPGWSLNRISGSAIDPARRIKDAGAIYLVKSPRGERIVMVILSRDAPNAAEVREKLAAEVLRAIAQAGH